MIEQLQRLSGYFIYPNSIITINKNTYFLTKKNTEKLLGIKGKVSGFIGTRKGEFLLCPLNHSNANQIRKIIPWLNPRTLGIKKSIGCGDRVGLATPGHIQA